MITPHKFISAIETSSRQHSVRLLYGSVKRTGLVLAVIAGFFSGSFAQHTEWYHLSGTDKDHTVDWDFYCTGGRNSGHWTRIAVPSNWELQGFGNYMYGNGKERSEEQGIYRYSFPGSASWKGKKIFLVFEGVMTDAAVTLNGRTAGPVHQGGFYQFRYDVTNLLRYKDSNRLEVKVSKLSANLSVNKAEREGDFWALSGIYRPVYLEIVPPTFIEKIAIDARADGSFNLITGVTNHRKGDRLEIQIKDMDGRKIDQPFSTDIISSRITLQNRFTNIKTWNPESPHLYVMEASVWRNNKILHTTSRRFGFRTAELRPSDGFYVNGVKVIFKGVNRHSAWPESGRTLSREISLLDVKLMKEMNMNAVRMSHYPPDEHFLDICDSLGLFVLDELTGWQAAYDTTVGRKLVRELVERDVNHPSIIMWANGNEGGWNRALDNDFHLYDPQKRVVYHPYESFNGVETKHYPDYNHVVNYNLYGNEVFFPTEFMHGLYDGGHAAGLQDFWELMLQYPYAAGGFLWDFADEGIVRTDKNGWIDTDGNHGADGILGPHREKEASYYAIKEIWSPVVIRMKNIPAGFDGQVRITNRFLYTNLDQCSFKWKLVSFPLPSEPATGYRTLASGVATPISLAPGETGYLDLGLPDSWQQGDALYLTAFGKDQEELCTWSWDIKSPGALAAQLTQIDTHKEGVIEKGEEGTQLVIRNGDIHYYFDRSTGMLNKVISTGKTISLSGGPAMAGGASALEHFRCYALDSSYVVEAVYGGDTHLNIKWTFMPRRPARMDYSYEFKGAVDYIGITLNYPEEKITGMKWLGRGPYRVWKNRMQGMQLNVWHKDYNNTITGESWDYPEFKGYHAGLYWVVIENKEKPFTVYSGTNDLFFQMLQPGRPLGAANDYTSPPFPDGNLGFLQAIPPIGTKFQAADQMGPQSQKNIPLSYRKPVQGSLWFEF